MLCVNPNPWEGNPFNHNKPKPLWKINHSKPKFFPRNQTQTHTQKTKPFIRFATVAITANSKKPILSLSRRRPFNPVSFPADPPFRQATHTQKIKTPAFFTETKHSKPIHSNPYPATHTQQTQTHFSHAMLFFTEIGFAVFFSQKPNKTFCLVSVKKTQQTHALFLLLFNRKHMLSIPLHLFIFISFSSISSLLVEPDPPDVIFLLCWWVDDMRFLCFVRFLCFLDVMCVRWWWWWWCTVMCALMMLMMKGELVWVNLDCKILYQLMLGRNIRQWLNRVKMWVPSLISEEYMVRSVINGWWCCTVVKGELVWVEILDGEILYALMLGRNITQL